MKDNKKTGRQAGLFLILIIAAGIPGVMFRGISSAMLEQPDLIQTLIDGNFKMRLSILLSFMAGIFGIAYSVTIYPVLRSFSKTAALAYLSLWIFQVGVATVGDVSHYILLETAQYASASDITSEAFAFTAAAFVKGYIGAHFLSLIIFATAFVFMHVQFLRFELLPKWLSIWGLFAAGTVFTVTWLQVFDQSVSFHFYNQNGIFMLVFTGYLLIRGFRPKK